MTGISGVHALIYSSEPEKMRAFFRRKEDRHNERNVRQAIFLVLYALEQLDLEAL